MRLIDTDTRHDDGSAHDGDVRHHESTGGERVKSAGWIVGRLLAVTLCSLTLTSGCDRLQGSTPQAAAPKEKLPITTPTAVSTPSPAPPAPAIPEAQIAARVNKVVITRDEYKRRLEQIPADRRPKTPEEHKAFLAQLVNEELIVQDAVARGLERDPKVQETLQDVRHQLLLDAFSKALLSQVQPTQQDVEAFYERNKAAIFKEPERLRLREIVTGTEDAAKAILVQLLQGADFQQLAREQSTSATKMQGGDLGYVVRVQDRDLFDQLGKPLDGKVLPGPLEKAAFALDAGGLSSVVKGPDGFVVLKCDERKPERISPLSEVADIAKNIVMNQKASEHIQSYMAELRNKAQVTETSQPLP